MLLAAIALEVGDSSALKAPAAMARGNGENEHGDPIDGRNWIDGSDRSRLATPLVGVVSWLAMLNANRMRDGRGMGGGWGVEEVGRLKCRILLTASCEWWNLTTQDVEVYESDG